MVCCLALSLQHFIYSLFLDYGDRLFSFFRAVGAASPLWVVVLFTGVSRGLRYTKRKSEQNIFVEVKK
jgi:hypothetical protein